MQDPITPSEPIVAKTTKGAERANCAKTPTDNERANLAKTPKRAERATG